ncbi:hypothetical protein AMTRI_Chr04g187160 [Amborella trichopoda]|uniref:Probable purine permease n=1 Tax=Amborella trichopoda TaxID=13333 RepID=W1P5P9_AMBTC|nr:purine permease 1 [Amborella trichopoda]ERN02936.1 hypothetical protein AMTR_s00135p00099660 [Amborella trichopoda]|eukprot:XP_006841261.3 purine permease 1 [Amborella trichopoda]
MPLLTIFLHHVLNLAMDTSTTISDNKSPVKGYILLAVNGLFLTLGGGCAPLVSRIYFLHGGQRKWFTAWIQTAAWPLLLIPLSLPKFFSKKLQSQQEKSHLTFPLALQSAGIGLLIGLDDYMYAFGLSYLPVSTSSLLLCTQLAFTALFAFVLVRYRFTAYSINAVVLLTLGPVLLGLGARGDRPEGVSGAKYALGYVMTVGTAAVFGLVVPLLELVYGKAKVVVTYTLVLEMQVIMYVVATAFCTVGMIANKDFQAIPIEAREFGLGEFKYYLTVVASGVMWQLFFIGSAGFIFCTSSMFTGVFVALQIPLSELLVVIFFHEKFTGEKGMALVLSMWGFVSYFYGEHLNARKKKGPDMDTAINQL